MACFFSWWSCSFSKIPTILSKLSCRAKTLQDSFSAVLFARPLFFESCLWANFCASSDICNALASAIVLFSATRRWCCSSCTGSFYQAVAWQRRQACTTVSGFQISGRSRAQNVNQICFTFWNCTVNYTSGWCITVSSKHYCHSVSFGYKMQRSISSKQCASCGIMTPTSTISKLSPEL